MRSTPSTSRRWENSPSTKPGAIQAYDNALMESFWGSMQIELLDRRAWSTRRELATAMFEWIEGFYNCRRRHSALGYLSQDEFETLHKRAASAA